MNFKYLRPVGQLAQRYRFGAACIALAVALAGANLWLRFDVTDLSVQQQEHSRQGNTMLVMIARGSQLRAELATARAATQRITENLVVEKNVPENFWYFYKIEQDTQAKLVELQQRPAFLQDSGGPASYKRVPYSLKFVGSFPAVIAALQRLETGPRLGRIDSFRFQRQDAGSENVVLQLDFELLGFP